MHESSYCEDCQSYYNGCECPYCEYDGKDEDFYREEKELELAEQCCCGAWQIAKGGKVVHVADCCCGVQ